MNWQKQILGLTVLSLALLSTGCGSLCNRCCRQPAAAPTIVGSVPIVPAAPCCPQPACPSCPTATTPVPVAPSGQAVIPAPVSAYNTSLSQQVLQRDILVPQK